MTMQDRTFCPCCGWDTRAPGCISFYAREDPAPVARAAAAECLQGGIGASDSPGDLGGDPAPAGGRHLGTLPTDQPAGVSPLRRLALWGQHE